MAKRKKIALLFSYYEGWIAGAYYVLNIVHALNTLPDHEMPDLTICATKKDFELLKTETKYPRLVHYNSDKPLQLPFHKRIINVMNRFFFEKNIFDPRLNHYDVDFIYPCLGFASNRYALVKNVFWIPDYQECYYQSYFNETELIYRNQTNKGILYGKNTVVFSSKSVQKDAYSFYPNQVATTFILPFTVTHPNIENCSIDKIREEFGISEKYFFCPNQFWQHKNHIVVLKAIKLLKDKGLKIEVLFSGKEDDHRNIEFISGIKQFCKQNNIEDYIKFLGFIDRSKQLTILKHSIAVIQPSLFEGWSTVVEDCKSLNKYVLLSDLDVHKEQIKRNCDFFPREDEFFLASLMERYFNNVPNVANADYSENVKNFAKLFMKFAADVKSL